MKSLILLLFVGFAAASYNKALDEAVDDALVSFREGMKSVSLRHAVGMPHATHLDKFQNEIVDKITDGLREALDNLLDKIKDHLEHGKNLNNNLLDKAKELIEKLKERHAEIGEKAKKLIGDLVSKYKDFAKKILDLLGFGDRRRRSLIDTLKDLLDRIELRKIITDVAEMLREKINLNDVKDYLVAFLNEHQDKLWGKAMLYIVNKYDFNVIADVILNFFKKDENNELLLSDHSLKELWEKVKKLFDDLEIEGIDQFEAFMKWLIEAWNVGFEKITDKIERIKVIAKQLLEEGNEIPKEILKDALEVLRPYKEELGELWEKLEKLAKHHL